MKRLFILILTVVLLSAFCFSQNVSVFAEGSAAAAGSSDEAEGDPAQNETEEEFPLGTVILISSIVSLSIAVLLAIRSANKKFG